MDYGLRGQTAVVTGADSGMGYETARLLLEEGARIVITDKETASIEAAAERLAKLGDVTPFAADVTKPADIAELHAAAIRTLGRVDILVHAAGITGPTGLFHELTDADWMQAIDTDFMGAVRMVRAFVPGMMEHKSGRIVLFGSEDALQPYADELPYCAAKAGILNLSKGLSKTYARHGILVNAVSPAYIATPMTDAMMQKRAKERGTSFDEAIDSFLDEERPTLELHRRGRPEEVAAAVLFLCSRQASFVNGLNLRVDGGSVATV